MAATGIGNPAGAVWLGDFGMPQTIGGVARNEIMSGGVFVFASGADNVVSSGLNSFVTADVLFTIDASGNQFNGINLFDTAVSGNCTVGVGGLFILQASAAVTGGFKVQCDGENAVENLGSVAGNVAGLRGIGRAVTGAASGGFAIIQVTP